MKKAFTLFSLVLLAGCSVGNVELTKEATACELSGQVYSPGELVPLGDDCNSCVCSTTGQLENCSANTCANATDLANPAATKCLEDGFSYEIRADDNGGQFGVCIDANEKECVDWEYFRGECTLGAPDASISEENISDEVAPTEEVVAPEVSDEAVVDDSTDITN